MKVLLAQNMVHLPSHGGASKSNRILMEQLAARGHDVRVVAPAAGSALTLSWPVDELVGRLGELGAQVRDRSATGVRFTAAGVDVHAVTNPSLLARAVIREARDFDPDWIVVPTDDPGGMILAAANAAGPGRVVYMIHTIQQLPFGPDAFYPSEAATALIHKSAGLISVSAAGIRYAERHAGLSGHVVRPDIYGGPHRDKGPDRTGFVTMINASVYKGIDTFLQLADAEPGMSFLAVKSWGTTGRDLERLGRRPNITVVDPVDDIDEVFSRTRVVVMPSVWDETFGYTCVEAMLRGIPVLAADVGGLPEAKLGVPHLLPVARVSRYRDDRDHSAPVAEVPAQPVAPWLAALRELSAGDRYDKLSVRSRAAAEGFVAGLDPRGLESYLEARPAPARSGRHL